MLIARRAQEFKTGRHQTAPKDRGGRVSAPQARSVQHQRFALESASITAAADTHPTGDGPATLPQRQRTCTGGVIDSNAPTRDRAIDRFLSDHLFAECREAS